MANGDTVVAAMQRLTKQQLHAKLMRGWSRAIDHLGRGRFVDHLDISDQALGKQLSGSMPNVELLDHALEVEPSVLDDWLAHHGKRLVDSDAVCDTDDISVLVSRLLNKLIEAQHPDSPGGRRIVPTEVFGMEDLLREVIQRAGTLLEQAATYRGDNVSAMRRAG